MLRCRGPTVSLAMIVRDEETTLPACLGSISGLFDETVVVNTGSVDQSRDVARSFGATVIDSPWCDDFSAARNMALSRCTSDYIFWLDADELLAPMSRARLARLLERDLGRDTVYIMYQISRRPDGSFGFAETLSPRLLPNHRGIRWCGRVYEEILTATRAEGLKTKFINLYITHCGFDHPASLRRKLVRQRELLEIERRERADDPVALFNLALTHTRIARCAHDLSGAKVSLHCLERLLEKGRGSIGPKLEASAYALLAFDHFTLGSKVDALRECEKGRLSHPSNIGLIGFEAFLMRDLGMWDKAEALYNLLPSMHDYRELRNEGDDRFLELTSAKIEAA